MFVQSILDGGRLVFQYPLPQGLATLADENFTAAVQLQMRDIRDEHEMKLAESLLSKQSPPAEVASCILDDLPTEADPYQLVEPGGLSPEPWEVSDHCADSTLAPSHAEVLHTPAPPPPVSEWEVWPDTGVVEVWPSLPPLSTRPHSAPTGRIIKQPNTRQTGYRPTSGDIQDYLAYTADLALAEKLQNMEVLEAEGYIELPGKKCEVDYHAGAHLLTQEERDQEVERGCMLAERQSSATSADSMRHMMGSPTKRGSQQGTEYTNIYPIKGSMDSSFGGSINRI